MTALQTLPEHAEQNDWVVSTREPDFFGDVRVSMLSAGGSVILLVFDAVGKLSGGYLTERSGKMFHTDKCRDVEVWLAEQNGPIE